MFTSSNWNALFLLNFWNARMLGWVLYFKMALKTGSLMFSVVELFELNFGILNFLTILEKQIIQSFCCFWFRCEHLFIFSQIYFLSRYWLVREQRFCCSPKFLIIYNIFVIQILVIIFFSFFSSETHLFLCVT